MAQPNVFYNNLRTTVNSFIQILAQLNQYNDMMAADASLAAAAATAAQASGRSDLATADFTNIGSAITQINFTYGSGAPTQKSYLYKIL
jgi:hypothetical protein